MYVRQRATHILPHRGQEMRLMAASLEEFSLPLPAPARPASFREGVSFMKHGALPPPRRLALNKRQGRAFQEGHASIHNPCTGENSGCEAREPVGGETSLYSARGPVHTESRDRGYSPHLQSPRTGRGSERSVE